MARRSLIVLALAVLLAGCASLPPGIYYPAATDPATSRVAQALYRAAQAAGDDPARYSFAFIRSRAAAAYSDDDATFYFTDGLAALPQPIVDAAVAHEVAHEVLGHLGQRRKLSLSMTAGFGVAGIFAPGVGLLDLIVNPLVVRAFSRRQELEADRKAVEILRAMGHAAPRRALAAALQALDAHVPKDRGDSPEFLRTHPGLEERVAALEPLEPGPPLVRAKK
jgi:Zn-dependent protease with chaperone function